MNNRDVKQEYRTIRELRSAFGEWPKLLRGGGEKDTESEGFGIHVADRFLKRIDQHLGQARDK